MLNKNQSHKRNSWKYAVIIPALIGFVVLFQIQVIAQEKQETITTKNIQSGGEIRLVIDKNSTDAEIKKDAALLKEKHGVTLKYSKVKRNSSGEITGIKVEFKDKEGNKGVSQVEGKEPIKPILFYKNESEIGFGKPKQMRVHTSYASGQNSESPIDISIDDSLDIVGNFDFNFDMDFEAPEAPEAPEFPEEAEAPDFSKMPEVPSRMNWDNQETKIVIKKDGKKPLVILNGKVIEGDESILSKKEIEELIKESSGSKQAYSYNYSSKGNNPQIVINGKEVMKLSRDAMANARSQMERSRSDMRKQRESMTGEQLRMKVEMEKARANIKWAEKDLRMDAAKMMEDAKAEMQKAKAEMEAAKAEFEKAKAELKNKK